MIAERNFNLFRSQQGSERQPSPRAALSPVKPLACPASAVHVFSVDLCCVYCSSTYCATRLCWAPHVATQMRVYAAGPFFRVLAGDRSVACLTWLMGQSASRQKFRTSVVSCHPSYCKSHQPRTSAKTLNVPRHLFRTSVNKCKAWPKKSAKCCAKCCLCGAHLPCSRARGSAPSPSHEAPEDEGRGDGADLSTKRPTLERGARDFPEPWPLK